MAMIEEICAALAKHQFDLSSEKNTQAEIALALEKAGILFEREKQIVQQRRIDFLCAGGVGIEVKLAGSAKTIFRQVEAYCGSPLIGSMIIATARTMGCPDRISGKRCVVFPLARGWL